MMTQLTFDELDRFTRELSSLTRAGIPIPDGLRHLAASLKPGRLQCLSAEIAQAVERGAALSQALAGASVATPPEFIAVMRCAEISGDMRSILEFTLEHSRGIRRHRSAVLTTFVYPVFVLVTLIGVLCFLAHSVIPTVEGLFKDMRVDLNFVSIIVFKASHVLGGPSGALIAAALIVLILSCLFNPPLHSHLYRLLGRIPGLRELTDLSDAAVTMKFLGLMLGRRVPFPIALRAAGLAVWQDGTRHSLNRMSEAVERGMKAGDYIGGHFPATAVYLFRQAEQRGDLARACLGIADYCEDRFDRLSKRSLAVLEPVLVLCVAIFIGLVLTAVYHPLLELPKMIGANS